MRNKKIIYIIGGTNGVGKSAFHRKILEKETPYINADFIAKDLAGGMNMKHCTSPSSVPLN